MAWWRAAWLCGVVFFAGPAAAAPPPAGAPLDLFCQTGEAPALRLTLIQAIPSTARQRAAWHALCPKLRRYLRQQNPGAVDRQAHERALTDLPYFQSARCQQSDEALCCTLTPRPMVVRNDLTGRLPWSMLRSDVKRRLVLRPGTVLHDMQSEVQKQQQRLLAYLTAEGYDHSTATVRALADPAGWPNQGVVIEASLTPGHTAKVREVRLCGCPLPEATAAAFFRHRLPLSLGRRDLRPEQLRDDEEALRLALQQAGYPAASVRARPTPPADGEVDLDVEVRSGPHLTLRFVGNAAIKTSTLRDVATFEAAAAVDALEVESTRRAMLEAYERAGYDLCDVRYAIERETPERLAVTFFIDEGQARRLQAVEFDGNGSFSAVQLRAEAGLLCRPSGLLTRRRLRRTVEHDVGALRRFYIAQGFGEVKVRASERSDASSIDVVFHILEGPRKRIAELQVVGAPAGLQALRSTVGAPLSDAAVEADVDLLRLNLSNAGYLQAKVEPRRRSDAGGVHLAYQVTPGPRAITGELFLSGNLRTAEGVIVQELPLRQGDPLDLPALGQMRRRLRRLNIFADVQLRPLGKATPQRDPQGRAVRPTWLELGVQERPVQSLDAVLSFSTDDWFTVGADFYDRNAFGHAISLALEGRLGFASGPPLVPRIGNLDRLEGRLQAPRPLALPFDVEVTAQYQYQDYAVFRARKSGGSAALLRQFIDKGGDLRHPGLSGRLAYELSQGFLHVYDTDAQLAALRRAPRNLPSATFARLVPGLRLDGRDSPLLPRRGYAADARLEVAVPAFAGPLYREAATFWRAVASLQGYLPLSELVKGLLLQNAPPPDVGIGTEVVLALSASYSLAGTFTGQQQVPDSETFYYGGDFSVRGLANRASQSALLATALVAGSGELRWTVWPTSWGDLAVAGFVDAASASLQATQLLQQTTVTAGPALRFVTVVGPFSVAYGWPVLLAPTLRNLPDVAPPHGRLHITFGTSF